MALKNLSEISLYGREKFYYFYGECKMILLTYKKGRTIIKSNILLVLAMKVSQADRVAVKLPIKERRDLYI